LHINYAAIGWKPAEILAAKLLRIPVITHLHASVQNTSSYIRYSSSAVAVSRYVAEHSDCRGVPTKVVHNVSDLDRFAHGTDLRSELGYGKNDILVAFLGQMIKAKGLEMFVDMAKRVRDRRAKFLVAGSLRKTQGAYTQAEIRGLMEQDSRIRYLGYRADVENLYATSDVIVMPSQWQEPCAMVLFEAAAAGKPVVATATGGTPEILRHGETGFLVERDDVERMTEYVERLIGDQELRGRMGQEARRIATEELAVKPVRELEELYASLVAS
jgi:glycosyltransferase involved in cell wall biosynthesis